MKLSVDEKDLLGRILEKPELRPFFFRKAKGLKWFEPLESSGFFRPENNPRPQRAKEEGYVTVPFWPALEYLVSASNQLALDRDDKFAKGLIKILRSVTGYSQKEGFSNYRTWSQFAKIIQNIPIKLLEDQDIACVDYWLDDPYDRSLVGTEIGVKWLPQMLATGDDQAHRRALQLLDVLFKINVTKSSSRQSRRALFRFDEWHAEKIAEKVAGDAGAKLGFPVARLFEQRLTSVLKGAANDKWSSVWRRAIEEHKQDEHNRDPESVLVSTFRDALLSAIAARPSEALPYVTKLLTSSFTTTKRVAILAIAEQFPHLRSLVGAVVRPKFFASNYRHEMWNLLNRRYSEFEKTEQQAVVKLIQKHVEKAENGEERKGATAYWRAIWLAAIKDFDPMLSRAYQREIEVAGSPPDHPEFSSYMTSGFVVHKSPYTLEELLALDGPSLAKRLKEYKDPGEFMGPGIEGLCKTLRQVFKTEPLRYVDAFESFLDADVAYIHELLEAYSELWSNKIALPWDDIWSSLLTFAEKLVGREDFWTNGVGTREGFVANANWIVSSLAMLVEKGVKSDEHAFSIALVPQAERVVLQMLAKESGADFSEKSDAVGTAINSPRGRCLEALINITLRLSRTADAKTGNHESVWKHFLPIYESELDRGDRGEYEFATLVANYLPNFFYLSRPWVVASLPKIFDRANALRWRCAISGYSYVAHIYEEVFSYLKRNGDFILALDAEFRDQVDHRMIENIAVGYLREYETLSEPGSLMMKLLGRAKYEELSHLIWFVWTLRDDQNSELRSKVFPLWKELNAVINTEIAEGRRIASRLCTWISFIDEVTEPTMGLMLFVAPYADETHNAFEVLEGLARISKSNPEAAHRIWMRVLEGSHPDYPEEALGQALKNIAREGPQGLRNARTIVDSYIKAGSDRPAMLLDEVLRTSA